ncbi:hypothetical protein TBR22_A34620 [Luteitalea sp. TBR-22]|uniref:PAS domain S-box protein n=1 Tax=Luteitalea sp. TBR-22 TaxID=2802971 RepID=UPI001AF638F4|nr:PAS domain S-box protein [Luteitalea sp. TBR-22]BCS34233.1 hypothetical protein TBR22_A34620 [Luteitalea sp. TBR-22]
MAAAAALPVAPRRILLVGNEPLVQQVLLAGSSGASSAVIAVPTLAEARACLATVPTDVIVSGLRLPDGLAVDLTTEAAAVPLLVLLAPGEEAMAPDLLRDATVDVLVKDDGGAYLALLSWRIDVARRLARDRAAAGRYHAEVLDSVADEIAVLDADGVITAVNRAWRTFGTENGAQPAVDHVGMNYLDVCRRAAATPTGGEAAVVADGLAAVLRGDSTHVELEYPCDSPTAPRWFSISITRLGGPRPGAVVAHRDITVRRLATAALRVSEQNLATMLQSIGDAVVATDAQGVITRMNPTAERLTGWPLAEALGRPLTDVLTIVDALTNTPAPNPVEEVLARGEVVGLASHTVLRRRDGEQRHIADSAAPIRDVTGAVVGVVMVFSDVTERYRSEQALRRAKELLDRTGELARVGGWEVDLETMRLTWTRETFRIAEIDSLVEPSLEEGINLFAPEARPVIAAAVQAASDTGTPYDLQLPIITAKGRHRWVQTQGFAERQGGRPVRLYGTFQDITERKAAEDALRASEQRLRDVVASTDGIVWEADAATFEFTSVSDYAERLLGYPTSDWLQPGFWASHIHPDDREWAVKYCVACTGRAEAHDFEYRFLARDGRYLWLRDIVRVVVEEGRPRWLRGLMVDITASRQAEQERLALEGRLAQAQKLESIGRLAGGVAHDFNNMLSVILGHAELALRQAPPSHPLHRDLSEIREAAQRSAGLTRQMLAFARKQAVMPRPLGIDDAIAGTLSLLRRLLGEDITLYWQPGGAWPVWFDPTQLDQILTNLCVNARDAISGVGTITISTRNVSLGPAEVAGGATAGDYVVVRVSDSGQGMDEATLANIFEPFYTTKPVGTGTGLGLAMVDGAVRQNGGFVTVSSQPGHGATFDVHLPRYVGAMQAHAVITPAEAPRQAPRARILLVEDDANILELVTHMLGNLGYVVLATSDPVEAIALAQAEDEPIELLLTDVIMPTMNGQELARAIRARWPRLEVLFMSGYTDDVIADRGLLAAGTHFLEKPFLAEDLDRAVKAALAPRGAA